MILISGIDQQRVEMRRDILATMSNYLDRSLPSDSDSIEVVLYGVDGQLLKDIVSFACSGHIEIHGDNVRGLLEFASKFEFKLLFEKCIEFYVYQLSVTNCVNWFVFADKNKIDKLRKSAFRMICTSFERISSRDICELDLGNFKEIIDSDDNTAREEMIFDQLVKWIQFGELGRSAHAFELLKCIRLKHITEKALIEKVMMFCQNHNIVGFTDNECQERMRNPIPVYQSRYACARGVFEIHERGSSVIIRVYDGPKKAWRRVMTIANDLPQIYYGLVFYMEKMFIIGGCTTETGKFLKDVDVFDFMSKTCMDLPQMIVARGFFNPIVVDEFIYVFGGYDGSALKDCERFNMNSQTWESLKPMQYGHHSLTVAAINAHIYVADGNYQNKGSCCTIERYDPMTDSWMKVASVLDPTFEGVLIEWKGLLYAVGVDAGSQRYDCERNSWVVEEKLLEVTDGEDEILSSLRKMRLKNFDYYREQVIVKEKTFFERLCASNSNEMSLDDFSRNLVMNRRNFE